MTSSITRKDLLTAMVDSDKPVSRVEIQKVAMGPKRADQEPKIWPIDYLYNILKKHNSILVENLL